MKLFMGKIKHDFLSKTRYNCRNEQYSYMPSKNVTKTAPKPSIIKINFSSFDALKKLFKMTFKTNLLLPTS